MTRRPLSLLLAILLLLSTAAFAAAETTPVTEFSAFFKYELPWDTIVAEEITKATGVKLNYVPIAGDATEKLNVMLVSDTVPDIVTIDRGADANDQYIANGKVIALDDLIDQYAPNIKAQLGNTLDKIRNKEDGKIYGLPSWFQDEVAPSAVFGFNLRMNYVKELGYYDSYVEKGYFTQSEFVSLLKDWKAKYPQINGHDTIAMTFNADNTGAYRLTFQGMFGISSYSAAADGSLQSILRDDRTKAMYMFINELYRDGLLDKDWPVNKSTLYNEKISNGYVLCAPDAYWNMPNSVLRVDASGNNNDDNMMYPFMVVADGVNPEDTTYGPTSVLGWSYTYISSTNPDPVATIKFFDYLISVEGQYLTQWGPEGLLWEYVDGVRTLKDDMYDELNKDFWTTVSNYGVRKYEILFKSGIAPDGQNYDLWNYFSNLPGKADPVTAFANKYLGSTAYDTTLYDDLGPDAGTYEALVSTKIDDLRTAAYPAIILAETAQEATQLYEQLLADADNAGLADLEAIANQKYARRLEIWGK